jgi:hypothetical protein
MNTVELREKLKLLEFEARNVMFRLEYVAKLAKESGDVTTSTDAQALAASIWLGLPMEVATSPRGNQPIEI